VDPLLFELLKPLQVLGDIVLVLLAKQARTVIIILVAEQREVARPQFCRNRHGFFGVDQLRTSESVLEQNGDIILVRIGSGNSGTWIVIQL